MDAPNRGGPAGPRGCTAGQRVARRIETGMVFVNSSAVSSPELPFGGVKHSGHGREKGLLALAMALLIITGEIDLSVASTAGLASDIEAGRAPRLGP